MKKRKDNCGNDKKRGGGRKRKEGKGKEDQKYEKNYFEEKYRKYR